MSCNLGEGEGVDIQEAIDTETWEGRKTKTFEDVSDQNLVYGLRLFCEFVRCGDE